VRARSLTVAVVAVTVVVACGTTEKDGSVGDELSANGIEVTVDRVDRSPPEPRKDISGLSKPGPGKQLVGAHVRVCSDHGGAVGAYHFGIETSAGKGKLKFPARNYRDDYETLRDDCGEGWIVFEIPAGARTERITFGFEDTGATRRENERVDAKFSWTVG
jgi:hypothetical protein